MDTRQDRLVAGRYRLLSPLGEGGMGTVWRALDELLGREVAVKEVTFPPGLSDDDREVLRERTRREARAAAALDHPSAVTVFDVVEEDGLPYLVMELVEARTLSQVVRSDGPLPPQEAARVGLALLGALEAAHRQGVLHRDVKPSNVMVTDDGRVVLTDFGIATSTGDPSLTHTGMLLGSPAYIAPERLRGQPLGPPSDLWSLGATLFTAVEGRPPFEGDEPLVTVAAVATGEHAPFALAGPLEPAISGLLTKDPDARLDVSGVRPLLERAERTRSAAPTQVMTAPIAAAATARTSALDLGEVREEIAAAEPDRTHASRPPALAPLARPPRRTVTEPDRARRGWLAPLAVGAVLVATAGVGVALASGDDDPGTSAAPPGPTASPSADASPQAPASTEPSRAPSPSAAAPSPTTAPSPAASEPSSGQAVPAGWSTDTGGPGWTVALPPGYEQTRAGEYRQASTGRTLRVESGPGRPDAVADREEQAADFADRHPTYEEIAIRSVDYRGYEAADWEFTYEGLRVLNRVFVVDGTGYSLFFQTPEGDFPDARADVDGIIEAFSPA